MGPLSGGARFAFLLFPLCSRVQSPPQLLLLSITPIIIALARAKPAFQHELSPAASALCPPHPRSIVHLSIPLLIFPLIPSPINTCLYCSERLPSFNSPYVTFKHTARDLINKGLVKID
jgi:hypothetical protein